MIRHLLAGCLALGCLVAGETALPPHQGTVVLAERSFAGVWITSESTDGVVHTLDDKKDSPPTTTSRGRYLRVDYVRPNEVAWIRADLAAAKGEWAVALTNFAEAAIRSRESNYTRESAFIRWAEAGVQAGKPEETLKALDGLLEAFPKSIHQPRALYLRGQGLVKKGDTAGALKAYTELAGKADWGLEATALGSLGLAELSTAGQKPDAAAKVLAAVFVKLDPIAQADLFSKVGTALATAQQAATQNDAAVATLRRLAYGSADPTARARAQFTWAKLLMAGGESNLFAALDQALIAMHTRGADGTVTATAEALARQLVGKIDKLPEAQASNDLKAEYRRYLSR